LLELADFGSLSATNKKIYEKPKNNNHNNTHDAWLLRVFTTNASGQSGAGRMLSRVHDSGRVRRTKQPHYWRWKYRPWLEVALLE